MKLHDIPAGTLAAAGAATAATAIAFVAGVALALGWPAVSFRLGAAQAAFVPLGLLAAGIALAFGLAARRRHRRAGAAGPAPAVALALAVAAVPVTLLAGGFGAAGTGFATETRLLGAGHCATEHLEAELAHGEAGWTLRVRGLDFRHAIALDRLEVAGADPIRLDTDLPPVGEATLPVAAGAPSFHLAYVALSEGSDRSGVPFVLRCAPPE